MVEETKAAQGRDRWPSGGLCVCSLGPAWAMGRGHVDGRAGARAPGDLFGALKTHNTGRKEETSKVVQLY